MNRTSSTPIKRVPHPSTVGAPRRTTTTEQGRVTNLLREVDGYPGRAPVAVLVVGGSSGCSNGLVEAFAARAGTTNTRFRAIEVGDASEAAGSLQFTLGLKLGLAEKVLILPCSGDVEPAEMARVQDALTKAGIKPEATLAVDGNNLVAQAEQLTQDLFATGSWNASGLQARPVATNAAPTLPTRSALPEMQADKLHFQYLERGVQQEKQELLEENRKCNEINQMLLEEGARLRDTLATHSRVQELRARIADKDTPREALNGLIQQVAALQDRLKALMAESQSTTDPVLEKFPPHPTVAEAFQALQASSAWKALIKTSEGNTLRSWMHAVAIKPESLQEQMAVLITPLFKALCERPHLLSLAARITLRSDLEDQIDSGHLDSSPEQARQAALSVLRLRMFQSGARQIANALSEQATDDDRPSMEDELIQLENIAARLSLRLSPDMTGNTPPELRNKVQGFDPMLDALQDVWNNMLTQSVANFDSAMEDWDIWQAYQKRQEAAVAASTSDAPV